MIRVTVQYRDGGTPCQNTIEIRGTCGNHTAAVAGAVAIVKAMVPSAIVESVSADGPHRA